MNRFRQQPGEGCKCHVVVIGVAAALLVIGGGRWSADGAVAETIAP